MNKPCDCKWYNRCNKRPGCTGKARFQSGANQPAYVSPLRAVSSDTSTVTVVQDAGCADFSSVVAVGVMLSNTDGVCVAPAPVYYEPAPSPAPTPCYESTSTGDSYSSCSSDSGSSSWSSD